MMNGSKELSIEAKLAEKRRAWDTQLSEIRTSHRVFLGDARRMSELGNTASVHLVVTSPPYWNLKEYPGLEGVQLGNLEDYRAFLGELTSVWRRCFELLSPEEAVHRGRRCMPVASTSRGAVFVRID
jgi:site-specific DNA-methyltransferase (adenine-specific)